MLQNYIVHELVRRWREILVSYYRASVMFSNLVPFEDLGDAKPSVMSDSNCVTNVITYSTPQYDADLADADGYKSAR